MALWIPGCLDDRFFMARILIIAKRFPPEHPATAVLGYELAEELSRLGHQVTVAAGYPHHPYGRLFPGYRPNLVSVEQSNGFRLVRGWHFIHPNPSLVIRSLIMISQCASYVVSSLKAQKPDVVISFDGYPLLGPLTSALIARHYRAKLILVIYDLYPDIAVELGKLKNPGLIKLARKLELMTYRYSQRIVTLSEGLRQTLIREKNVNVEKVTVIPVWLAADDVYPLPRDNSWRLQMNIPLEKFVVLYAGTIGLVAGAEVLVQAAQHLSTYPDILFLLVGDGYGKEQVQKQAKNSGLSNLRFLPFQDRAMLSKVQATADISVVTLAPGRGRTSVPSKVLGYMAAARPIVTAVDANCDTAAMIRQAGCGVVVHPGNGVALAKGVLHYYKESEKRKKAGEKGRSFYLKHFEKKIVIQKYHDLLSDL
jgi:colanic acid biosynthesis glycosyl transferase WcaI